MGSRVTSEVNARREQRTDGHVARGPVARHPTRIYSHKLVPKDGTTIDQSDETVKTRGGQERLTIAKKGDC